MKPDVKIAVLGASGLIGSAVADDLQRRGIPFVAIARRFTATQRTNFADSWIESPVVDIGSHALGTLFAAKDIDLVINCVGVLQDGVKGTTGDVHARFANTLIEAIHSSGHPILLIQISIPGRPADDRTAFSKTKRAADEAIIESGIPFVILRPGFVIASAAYGGSALIRALAASPFELPKSLTNRPFAATAVADIAGTVAWVSTRWRGGERDWHAVWDVMETTSSTLGDVVAAFRNHFGGPRPFWRLPLWLLVVGARCGDLASVWGWSPPVRSTAVVEIQRGVCGDPLAWMAATGIRPKSVYAALNDAPPTIQEKWFARLYFAKLLIIAILSFFWIASGLIALTFGARDAMGLLISHGLRTEIARALLVGTGVIDILIGVAIGVKRASPAGLMAGILVSLIYLISATFFAPELWFDPVGPLVKVLPVIALMAAGIAVADDR
jgi:uncharacterized protein YbjT (DUF2867 family)